MKTEASVLLFNEKYGIAHVSYNSGRVLIEHTCDEELPTTEDNFNALIHGFSRLTGGRRESLGMMQYRVESAPFDFIFQLDNLDGIVISVEDMRRVDETVRYIKESLSDINYNMLYQNAEY